MASVAGACAGSALRGASRVAHAGQSPESSTGIKPRLRNQGSDFSDQSQMKQISVVETC